MPPVIGGELIENKTKTLSEIFVRATDSISFTIQPNDQRSPFRVVLQTREGKTLFDGVATVSLSSEWDYDVQVSVSSLFPYQINGLIMRVDVGDQERENRDRL